jgi:uncharacterized glyoxalase superfamily metalloenzyme YdcJ
MPHPTPKDLQKKGEKFFQGVKNMSAVKDIMIKVIQEQPEDSDFDEILRELAFVKMVNRGLADSDAGRTVSHEEIEKRMQAWRK